jgi:hypothetical protein
MSDEKVKISVDRAISIMADGDQVHTFRQAGFALLGCDWDRGELIDRFRRSPDDIELGGEACQGMNHGLVLMDNSGPLFIECRPETDYAALEKELTGVTMQS